jgi:hypothetical protein
MSVEPEQQTEFEGEECRNAREYALQRVEEEAGEILKSEDLAEEYQCTQGHMQTVLRELAKDGEIKRVGWGRYAAIPAGEGSEEPDAEADEEEEEGDELPSVGGGVRSQGIGTRVERPEDEDADEPIQCPEERCEYEGFSVDGLRKHSNAVRSHDWEDIKDEIDVEELDDYERSEDVHGESMVTEEELQMQRPAGARSADQEEESEDDQGDDVDDEQEALPVEEDVEEDVKGIPLPVSKGTLVLGIGVAVGGFLLWKWMNEQQMRGTHQNPQDEQNQQLDGFSKESGLI